MTTPEGEYALAKYEEMMELLLNLEEEIFNDWSDEIPEICNVSLAKTLLLVDPETRLLTLNFDKEVSFCSLKVFHLKLLMNGLHTNCN